MNAPEKPFVRSGNAIPSTPAEVPSGIDAPERHSTSRVQGIDSPEQGISSPEQHLASRVQGIDSREHIFAHGVQGISTAEQGIDARVRGIDASEWGSDENRADFGGRGAEIAVKSTSFAGRAAR